MPLCCLKPTGSPARGSDSPMHLRDGGGPSQGRRRRRFSRRNRRCAWRFFTELIADADANGGGGRMKEGRLEPCLPRMRAVFSCSGVSGFLRPHQAPLFLGCSRRGYCNGLPCPPPGDPPHPETEAASCVFPALTGGFFTPSGTWETLASQ